MKKNKIVNKIGILVLAVMLSILSSITVLASEPEEAELGPRQDINKIFYADVVGDYIGIYYQSHKEKSVKGGRKTAEFPLDTLFLLAIMSEGKMAVSPFRYFPLCFIVRSGGRK